MLIGDPRVFAIECYSEAIPGYASPPVGLVEPDFVGLTDRQVYELLDRALYGAGERRDRERSAQTKSDAAFFGKFDFLTNASDSFDRTKSFIDLVQGDVRVIFTTDGAAGPTTFRVERGAFVRTVETFVEWFEREQLVAAPHRRSRRATYVSSPCHGLRRRRTDLGIAVWGAVRAILPAVWAWISPMASNED